MKILVLNCGSSSIKYQLFNMAEGEDVIAAGVLERINRIGGNPSTLSQKSKKYKDCEKVVFNKPVKDHTEGIHWILETLVDPEVGAIEKVTEITAVGHRVVHGGEKFSESVTIDQEVIDQIEEVSNLAPLHNPANLMGINAINNVLPDVPQCAVFDTAFHQTMPSKSYMYALPYELYEKHKIRRYGFHGTSHKYISNEAAKLMGKDISDINIITCHLGNGASMAAVQKGKSVDTSMGLTPLEGLIMGSRCGDVGIGVVFHLMEQEQLTIEKCNSLLNKESGMLGISGVSGDMRDIYAEADKGNERAKIALEMYDYRIKKYIGAYTAAMGGVDAIVFTGGIGENNPIDRENICRNLEYMGVEFDADKNADVMSSVAEISKTGSKVKVFVIPTNEELVIARETLDLLK